MSCLLVGATIVRGVATSTVGASFQYWSGASRMDEGCRYALLLLLLLPYYGSDLLLMVLLLLLSLLLISSSPSKSFPQMSPPPFWY
jgi:hypothetical protein